MHATAIKVVLRVAATEAVAAADTTGLEAARPEVRNDVRVAPVWALKASTHAPPSLEHSPPGALIPIAHKRSRESELFGFSTIRSSS